MSQPEKPWSSDRGNVAIQVTGKNVDATEAFQSYVTASIAGVMDKFFGPGLSGHVRVEKERGRFHTQVSTRLRTGLVITARGDSTDAYTSADLAIERLEKRLRRYKRRLKNRHHPVSARLSAAAMESGDSAVGTDEETDESSGAQAPMIVAETQDAVHALPVSAAALELSGTDRPFLVFRNAAHGRLNVVYRRADGNIGWLDLPAGTASSVQRADGATET